MEWRKMKQGNKDIICLGNWRENKFTENEVRTICTYLANISSNSWNSNPRINSNSRGRFLIGVPKGYYGKLTSKLDGINWKLYKSVYNTVLNPEIIIELSFYGNGFFCLHKASNKVETDLYTFYNPINDAYEEIVRKIAEPLEDKSRTKEELKNNYIKKRIRSLLGKLEI